MSSFSRVQQWSVFSRKWWIYDANRQNPFSSAKKITDCLEGKNKPIFSPLVDSGDHVIVINSQHVALLGREWQLRVYFHHPGYPKTRGGGAKWIPAWQLHERDPTLILWKACYNNLYGDLTRKGKMARLHIFPDSNVPQDLLNNVTGQISQVKPTPKKLSEHSQQEIDNFPKVWEYPHDHVKR